MMNNSLPPPGLLNNVSLSTSTQTAEPDAIPLTPEESAHMQSMPRQEHFFKWIDGVHLRCAKCQVECHFKDYLTKQGVTYPWYIHRCIGLPPQESPENTPFKNGIRNFLATMSLRHCKTRLIESMPSVQPHDGQSTSHATIDDVMAQITAQQEREAAAKKEKERERDRRHRDHYRRHRHRDLSRDRYRNGGKYGDRYPDDCDDSQRWKHRSRH